MQIGSLGSAYQAQEVSLFNSRTSRKEQNGDQPSSWGHDQCSISPAAREAYEASKSGKQQEKDDGAKVREEFSKYMDRARGDDPNCGDDLESLKAKLKDLQSKLESEAKNEKTSGEVKASKMEALQEEIANVAKRIAELENPTGEGGFMSGLGFGMGKGGTK